MENAIDILVATMLPESKTLPEKGIVAAQFPELMFPDNRFNLSTAVLYELSAFYRMKGMDGKVEILLGDYPNARIDKDEIKKVSGIANDIFNSDVSVVFVSEIDGNNKFNLRFLEYSKDINDRINYLLSALSNTDKTPVMTQNSREKYGHITNLFSSKIQEPTLILAPEKEYVLFPQRNSLPKYSVYNTNTLKYMTAIASGILLIKGNNLNGSYFPPSSIRLGYAERAKSESTDVIMKYIIKPFKKPKL